MSTTLPMPGIGALAWMWAAMMAAMMAPAAIPSTRLYARMSRGALRALPYAAGYLGTWAAAGVIYALVHGALRAAGLLEMGMRLASTPAAGALLVAAGVYQWSPLKARCVARCRSPLGFMLNEWRDGAWGALRMGARYATWCVGCCWMMMTVLFVVGAMSLTGAATIAAYALAERLVRAGAVLDRAVGVGLAAWGVWLIAR